ncbi:MAG: hypothetical protein JF587_05680 [Catenulisporales bacterium]|nr:hypothetical protein [Catenulisporales bacterium]
MTDSLLPKISPTTLPLAHGRPYSAFEELLLKQVYETTPDGGCGFNQLRATFKVHNRLITEGLVTLIQEGWVAIVQQDQEMRYLVTEAGNVTIESGRRPENRHVRTAYATIARERLTGQLARANDLALVTNREVQNATKRSVWSQALKPSITRTAINGGEAERLLYRSSENQEWVRWIDSVVRVSQDAHYLPVQVDINRSQVIGLPDRWQHLGPLIVAQVAERVVDDDEAKRFHQELQELLRSRPARHTAARQDPEQQPDDAGARRWEHAEPFVGVAGPEVAVGTTVEAGSRLAWEALNAAAGSVLIVTAGLTVARAKVARDLLLGLRGRGVNADFLWSAPSAAECDKEILSVLGATRVNKSPGTDVAAATIVYNRTLCPATADLMLVETTEGPVAIAGDVLLDEFGDSDGTRLSPAVRFAGPAALASLARLCAGWWEELPANEGALPAHRWKHLAERWAGQAAASTVEDDRTDGTPLTAVDLFIGPQREAAQLELRDRSSVTALAVSARTRVTVGGDRMLVDAVEAGALGLSYCVMAPTISQVTQQSD